MIMDDLTTPKCPACGNKYIDIKPSESKPDHAIGICKICTFTWAIWVGNKPSRCAGYEVKDGKEIYCEEVPTQIRLDLKQMEHWLCKKHADEVDRLLESKEAQLRHK